VPSPEHLHISDSDCNEYSALSRENAENPLATVFPANIGNFSAVGSHRPLHVVGIVARRHGDVVSSDAADGVAVVARRLTPGERLD